MLNNLVVFHKSGILLFSYDFQKNEEVDESLLKGTILIGINHILANFSSLENKLNVIKMKDRDILLEYNIDLGYAVLLLTEQKNEHVRRSLKRFISALNAAESDKLNKLEGLIDLSQFKGIKKVFKRVFQPYLKS